MIDRQTITLNNGVAMPALGFGVFQTPPDETRVAVDAALDLGYRHVDTAAAYGNERQVEGQRVAGERVVRVDDDALVVHLRDPHDGVFAIDRRAQPRSR